MQRVACRTALLFTALSFALCGCDQSSPTRYEGRPGGPYQLMLELAPGELRAGHETRLTTELTYRKNGAPVGDLQIVHERVLHNFIVNLDFSSFAHIHHEDFASLDDAALASGRLSFPYTFPKTGRYRMVSQFTHKDRSWTKHFDIAVGNPGVVKVVEDLARDKRFGDYRARLDTSPKQLVAGFEAELVLELERRSQPVTDLQLLLGSEVHVALWRLDGKYFGHTHSYTPHMAMMLNAMHDRSQDAASRARAMDDMMVKMINMPAELVFHGPEIPIHYVFPEPGTYALFFHLSPRGEILIVQFMVDVAAYRDGMSTAIESIVTPHGGPDS